MKACWLWLLSFLMTCCPVPRGGIEQAPRLETASFLFAASARSMEARVIRLLGCPQRIRAGSPSDLRVGDRLEVGEGLWTGKGDQVELAFSGEGPDGAGVTRLQLAPSSWLRIAGYRPARSVLEGAECDLQLGHGFLRVVRSPRPLGGALRVGLGDRRVVLPSSGELLIRRSTPSFAPNLEEALGDPDPSLGAGEIYTLDGGVEVETFDSAGEISARRRLEPGRQFRRWRAGEEAWTDVPLSVAEAANRKGGVALLLAPELRSWLTPGDAT